MRLLALTACVPLLFACAHSGQPIDAEKQIRLITYESTAEVDSACRDAGYKTLPFPLTVIEGCAVWTDQACTILARGPTGGSDTDAFRVLGHEALHCFGGDWHGDMQRTGIDLLPGRASASILDADDAH